MLDSEMFEEWLVNLAERYEAYDLIEMLDNQKELKPWDILEVFRDRFFELYVQLDEEDGD